MPSGTRTVGSSRAALALVLGLTACATEPNEELRALSETQDGLITFYAADGTGNCSFDASPDDLDVAAMNDAQYLGSAVCGACAEVEGPKGQVRVRIVDRCPECGAGHLDMSREAFAKVADPSAGRVSVRWRLVPCAVQGPLRYRFKEGSSQWWTALQVRNHRLPVARLEWWKDSAWVEVARESYNYFVEPSGMGTGPVRVRVTASDGQQREDTLPGIQEGHTFDGTGQFDAP